MTPIPGDRLEKSIDEHGPVIHLHQEPGICHIGDTQAVLAQA